MNKYRGLDKVSVIKLKRLNNQSSFSTVTTLNNSHIQSKLVSSLSKIQINPRSSSSINIQNSVLSKSISIKLNNQREDKLDQSTLGTTHKEKVHRKRRRCCACYCPPWCLYCCCFLTILVLAGIAAGIMALLDKSSKQINSPTLISTKMASSTSTSTATTSSTVTTNTPIPIVSFNGFCVNDSYCNETELLICENSTCVCNGNTSNGTWFWGGTSCLLCPDNWMNFQTECYYLSTIVATWNDSRTYCQSYDADLMVIQSLAEYYFITNVAQTLMPTTNWVEAWIGLQTIIPSPPGLFRWLDGTNITGLNPPNYIWCQWPNWWTQPDYNSYQSGNITIHQMCCGLVHAAPPTWPSQYVCVDDNYCDYLQQFICKKSN